jgi:hypothetical protein
MRSRRLSVIVLACVAALLAPAPLRARQGKVTGEADSEATARELETFKTWLQRTHPGYGCDAGPGPFLNATVQAAYPGRRFYYVLTNARGIAPPSQNSVSLVADIDGDGAVRRLDGSSIDTFRLGLRKVSSASDARQAVAAVLVLALGDPGEKRWPIKPSMVMAKKDHGGWVCTYYHDSNHPSEVRFDKNGALSSFNCMPPPVP